MSEMLARVSHLPEVDSVASPYLPGGKVQLSPDGRTAYATVNFTQTADYLNNADVNQVIAVATADREPGLAIELGGKAISDTEQAPLSSVSAIGIGAPPSYCSSRSARYSRRRCRSRPRWQAWAAA